MGNPKGVNHRTGLKKKNAPNKAAFLKFCREHDASTRSIRALCTEFGLGQRTLYCWLADDPEFKKAWEQIWRIELDGQMPAIVGAQVEKALEGDTPAANFCARIGKYMTEKIELPAESGATLVVYLPQEKAE